MGHRRRTVQIEEEDKVLHAGEGNQRSFRASHSSNEIEHNRLHLVSSGMESWLTRSSGSVGVEEANDKLARLVLCIRPLGSSAVTPEVLEALKKVAKPDLLRMFGKIERHLDPGRAPQGSDTPEGTPGTEQPQPVDRSTPAPSRSASAPDEPATRSAGAGTGKDVVQAAAPDLPRPPKAQPRGRPDSHPPLASHRPRGGSPGTSTDRPGKSTTPSSPSTVSSTRPVAPPAESAAPPIPSSSPSTASPTRPVAPPAESAAPPSPSSGPSNSSPDNLLGWFWAALALGILVLLSKCG